MKKFALTFAILCAFSALTFAGTEPSGKDKEVMQPAPPPCDWYRSNEWNLGIWGAYAFSGNEGEKELFDESADANLLGEPIQGISSIRVTERNDKFLDRDNAWGGGIDVKYFFNKYWALGGEGFLVDARKNVGGAGLGTFTLRYPIGCSRFAPYAFAGVGAIGGGSKSFHITGTFEEGSFDFQDISNNTHTDAVGQFGAGMEVRLLHPSEKCKIGVGIITDFAWNVVSGPDNNFGMWRFGLNFNY